MGRKIHETCKEERVSNRIQTVFLITGIFLGEYLFAYLSPNPVQSYLFRPNATTQKIIAVDF
jgi:hypothetical protein